MNKLDMQGKVYDAKTAENVAHELQASDRDGWQYVVEVQKGFGRIAVYDENGQFVGHF